MLIISVEIIKIIDQREMLKKKKRKITKTEKKKVGKNL